MQVWRQHSKAHVTNRTNSAATHRFALCRTVILFFQQDNEPEHAARLDTDGLTNKESDGVVGHMTRLPLSPQPKSQLRRFGMSRTAAKRCSGDLEELLQDSCRTVPGDHLLAEGM